jgi:chromosomal replication initiation ATPase DnaA
MSVLIGRDREISLIRNYIKEMKPFHIYGSEGVGKTALLEHVYSNWNYFQTPLVPIFCRTSRTLREILIHITGYLLYSSYTLQNIDKFKRVKEMRYKSDLKTINSRDLKNIIFRNISNRKFCLILDHLEHVTPKINAFLAPLKDVAMTITASRQSWELTDYQFKSRLDYCLWLLQKIKVENLTKHDTFLLMKSTAGDALKVNEDLFTEVYHITKGNPGLTKEVLAKVSMPEYRIDENINLKLIMIDLGIESLKE